MNNASSSNPFRCALEGIADALATQRHLRIHIAVAGLVALSGILLRLPRADLLLLLIAVALVVIAELINTAVELAVDLASPAFDPIARRAKNIAAGAVLTAALASAVIGIVILAPPLSRVLLARPFSVESALLAATALVLVVTILTAFLPRPSRRDPSSEPAPRQG
jgi:diacylglycerol kinase